MNPDAPLAMQRLRGQGVGPALKAQPSPDGHGCGPGDAPPCPVDGRPEGDFPGGRLRGPVCILAESHSRSPSREAQAALDAPSGFHPPL